MPNQKQAQQTLGNMRKASLVLSEMLAYTVSEVRRLQQKDEEDLARSFASREELNKSYDPKTMKDLTAILKDVAAVEKALSESAAEQEAAAATGVVLLPAVTVTSEDAPQTE